ncbi:MAG TPA: C-terminal binding protein [Puia sp.]|nr:C-terminal binding protein [Puia sp.]
MSYQIVITDSAFPTEAPENEIFGREGYDLVRLQCRDDRELQVRLGPADAILVESAPITAPVIEALQNCKIIVRYGHSVDNIDLYAARSKGIPVCNVPDYCINEVADHTVALALAALRQIPETDRRVRQYGWQASLPRPVRPFSESIFCLAGFGRIAREVARRARALGFTVMASDPFVSPEVMAIFDVVTLPLDDLLRIADVLSLHCPLNAETNNMIRQDRLSLMKPGAVLVNTAQGDLVDAEDLSYALKQGELWAAAVDVFDTEPLPPHHPLRQSPNTILSSHVAWYSSESTPLMQRKAAQEAVRALKGMRLLNRVI